MQAVPHVLVTKLISSQSRLYSNTNLYSTNLKGFFASVSSLVVGPLLISHKFFAAK